MKSIWKYPLGGADRQAISMPTGAQILTVQIQRGTPTIWALVDPTAAQEKRIFLTVGTGEQNDHIDGRYVGTYQLLGGDLVFHVFERST